MWTNWQCLHILVLTYVFLYKCTETFISFKLTISICIKKEVNIFNVSIVQISWIWQEYIIASKTCEKYFSWKLYNFMRKSCDGICMIFALETFHLIFAWFSHDFLMKRKSHENHASLFTLCMHYPWVCLLFIKYSQTVYKGINVNQLKNMVCFKTV